MQKKYGSYADEIHTDLHECLGHGSGQLLPGVSANAMGEFASALEEARADLFGLRLDDYGGAAGVVLCAL